MGRYFDEVAEPGSTGLDPSNGFYSPVINAAKAINDLETAFFDNRKRMFEELDFNDGDFNQSTKDVEDKYEEVLPTVSVYNYKTKFDEIDPPLNNPDPRVTRYVHNTYPLSGMTAGLADQFLVEIGDDEDGAVYGNAAENGFPVLAYTLGNGKAGIDPLYTNVSAFTSERESATPFYVEEIDEDEGNSSIRRFNDVFKGFSEVPYRYQATGQWSQQQLGVLKAAGDDYENELREAIGEFERLKVLYDGRGGGQLEEVFHGNNSLIGIYQDYQGAFVGYNRPGELPAVLIKEARGLT